MSDYKNQFTWWIKHNQCLRYVRNHGYIHQDGTFDLRIAVILFILTKEKSDRKYKSTSGFTQKCKLSNIQETSTILTPPSPHTETQPKRQCGDLTPGGAVGQLSVFQLLVLQFIHIPSQLTASRQEGKYAEQVMPVIDPFCYGMLKHKISLLVGNMPIKYS